MIRQAISCDICGAEKKQTNHWFVACETAGELRVGGWNSRMRQRPGSKHLCGQTCLHKLMDEFMARTIGGRLPTGAAEAAESTPAHPPVDASLTSAAAYTTEVSSARLISAAGPVLPPPPASRTAAPAPVVPMQPRVLPQSPLPAGIDMQPQDSLDYSPRRSRAEAWERERNRELRSLERQPESLRLRKRL